MFEHPVYDKLSEVSMNDVYAFYEQCQNDPLTKRCFRTAVFTVSQHLPYDVESKLKRVFSNVGNDRFTFMSPEHEDELLAMGGERRYGDIMRECDGFLTTPFTAMCLFARRGDVVSTNQMLLNTPLNDFSSKLQFAVACMQSRNFELINLGWNMVVEHPTESHMVSTQEVYALVAVYNSGNILAFEHYLNLVPHPSDMCYRKSLGEGGLWLALFFPHIIRDDWVFDRYRRLHFTDDGYKIYDPEYNELTARLNEFEERVDRRLGIPRVNQPLGLRKHKALPPEYHSI